MRSGILPPAIAGLLLLSLPLPAQEKVPAAQGREELNFIAAQVNDEIITAHEVMNGKGGIADAVRAINRNGSLSLREKEKQIQELWMTRVRDLVVTKLYTQAAKKLGIEIDSMLRAKIKAAEAEVGGPENLLKILGDQGIELTDFQESFRYELTRRELLLRKFGVSDSTEGKRPQVDLFITPTEIRDFYDRNKSTRFSEPPVTKIRWIVLYWDKIVDPAAPRASAERSGSALAASIVLQARQGADFESLAREYSHHPTAKLGGGYPVDADLKWRALTPEDGAPTEVNQAAFSLPPGTVSEPISTVVERRPAFVIVQVVESKPVRIKDLREVHDEIYDALYQQRGQQAIRRFEQELRKDAYIWPANLFDDTPRR